MTPINFQLMKKHFKQPFKCVVLLRNLMDVLASYMQWYTENSDAFPNRFNLNSDEEKLSMIMKFMGEPYFDHRFNNVDQVNVNGLSYDDRVVGSNMHKLFDGPVRKVYNPYIEKIPERIKQKYEHIRF